MAVGGNERITEIRGVREAMGDRGMEGRQKTEDDLATGTEGMGVITKDPENDSESKRVRQTE